SREIPRCSPSIGSCPAIWAITPKPGADRVSSFPCSTSVSVDTSPGTGYSFRKLSCWVSLTVGPPPTGERLRLTSTSWRTCFLTILFSLLYQRILHPLSVPVRYPLPHGRGGSKSSGTLTTGSMMVVSCDKRYQVSTHCACPPG